MNAAITNERELGVIGERLKNLEKGQIDANIETKEHRENFDERLDEIKRSQDQFQSEVRAWISEARGAWKATTIIATIAGSTAALAWKIGLWILTLPIK